MADIGKVDNVLNFMLRAKSDAGKIKKDMDSLKGGRGESIKSRTKGLILQYPCLVSDAITAESASAVLRTLEHEYANLLTLLINDESIVDTPEGMSTSSYISGFHNNVLESTDTNRWSFKEANKELLNETYSSLINRDSMNDITIDREVVKFYNEAEDRNDIDRVKMAVEKHRMAKEKHEMDKERFKDNKKADALDYALKGSAAMQSNDVKKLNDAVPTLIKGTITYTKDGVSIPKLVNFGVKAVCHSVPTTEMSFNLATKVGNPSLLMKFIDWTTGEKKLLTDIVMEKRTMKSLAKTKGKSNFWFRKLEKMSNDASNVSLYRRFMKNIALSKIGKLLNLDRQMPIPCVSLVVSKSEVDQIAAEHGVDLLSNKVFAKEIMDKYYLLSLIVVDDVSSTAYFYNDVSKRFIRYSMKQLKGFAKDDMLTPEEALKKSLMR